MVHNKESQKLNISNATLKCIFQKIIFKDFTVLIYKADSTSTAK